MDVRLGEAGGVAVIADAVTSNAGLKEAGFVIRDEGVVLK